MPGDAESALVVLTESLPADAHDALVKLVESAAGQQAYELAEAMERTYLPDGMNMLYGFHKTGCLRKVATKEIEMLPDAKSSIKLDELNKMIAQQKASDKGVSANTIQVKGNVILAKYFVYIEVYDFAISEDEEIQVSSAEVKQKTTIGLQVRFVDAETGEIITGSGLGEAITVKKASLLDGVDEVKFNQSTIGISTKKSLETAASRVVSKLIKKGVFRR